MIGVDGSGRDGGESGRDGEDISLTSFFLLLLIYLFLFIFSPSFYLFFLERYFKFSLEFHEIRMWRNFWF